MSKQVKKRVIEEGLLGPIVQQPAEVVAYSGNTAPWSTGLPPMLPTTSGKAAVPVVATTAPTVTTAPTNIGMPQGLPNMVVKKGESMSENWTEVKNQAEIDAVNAKQAEADARAKDYNENQYPTLLNASVNTYKGQTPAYALGGTPVTGNYLPVLPRTIVAEKYDVPQAILAHYGRSKSVSESTASHLPKAPKPTPGTTYGLVNDGGTIKAVSLPAGGYQESGARSAIMSDAKTSLAMANNVIAKMFGTNSELTDIKPNTDLSMPYYKVANGKLTTDGVAKGLGLTGYRIPDAIMKVAKNIYVQKYGSNGLDLKNAKPGDYASALKYMVNSTSGNYGGGYETNVESSIWAAIDRMGLTVNALKNGNNNNTLVNAFRNNDQFKDTLASGDRSAIDNFVKDSRAILKDAVYALLMTEGIGKATR